LPSDGDEGPVVWGDGVGGVLRVFRRPELMSVKQPLVARGPLTSRAPAVWFSSLQPYDRVLTALGDRLEVRVDAGVSGRPTPDARVVFFGYDFRQPIDMLAGELSTFVHDRLRLLGLGEAGLPVVVLAHSMGGLVARAWMAQGGAGLCRQVITYGTPFRGAPKALDVLVHGLRFKGLPIPGAASEVIREWRSMSQLAPWYPLQVEPGLPDDHDNAGGGSEVSSPNGLYAEDLPGLDGGLRERLRDARGWHNRLQDTLEAAGEPWRFVPVYTVGHPTLNHPTVRAGALRLSDGVGLDVGQGQGHDLSGDGTVPWLNAIPPEQHTWQSRGLAVRQLGGLVHGRLLFDGEVIADRVLHAMHDPQPPVRAPGERVGSDVGMSFDALVSSAESLTVRLLGIEPPVDGMPRLQVLDRFGRIVQDHLLAALDAGAAARVELDPLPAGRYTVRLTGVHRGPASDEVWSIDPELLEAT
jgi:hypothetical protein